MKWLEKIILLLLLPSLFLAAREFCFVPAKLAYRQMVSTNNFNELAMAFQRYGNDHDQQLPLSDSKHDWVTAINPYLDKTTGAPTHDVYSHPLSWELNQDNDGARYGAYGYNDALAAGLHGKGEIPWKYSDIKNLDHFMLIGERAWNETCNDRGLAVSGTYPEVSRGPAANHRSDKDPKKGPHGGMAYLTPRLSSKRITYYPGEKLLQPQRQPKL